MPHHLGSKNPKSKLEESDIPLIRDLIQSGFSDKDIAQKFEVSPASIWGIRVGRYWVHV